MLKIAITGPESTGKSTITEALALHYNCVFVAEYAREFLGTSGGKYDISDLDSIAKKQFERIQEAKHSSLVFCDTEMTVMKVWSDFKYGRSSETINSLLEQQTIDYYFLCDIDIPWEEDPLREHPENREELLRFYQYELRNKAYTVLSGPLENRVQLAIKIISQLLGELKN